VIFRQFIHEDLGCASYFIGDESAGEAAVVDPRFEIDDYLRLARYMGVSIAHILETHNHADHVSGHGRLAAATGARIYVHEDAGVDYDHVSIGDGFELEIGELTVRALHTPGHRPEHTAFVLIDRGRGGEPVAVLSGDSLFVNDVARPDLAIEPREGAEGIFRSLHEKLLELPETCEVWPGHLGGSMCGGPGMDIKVSSTIGFERRHNPALSIEEESEFVEDAVAKLGPQPPNFEAIVALNRGPLSSELAEVLSLTPRQVEQKQSQGAMLVDARTDHQFDDAHIPGAICIPAMRAGFGSRLAWLADRGQEIVFVGRDDDDGRRAARLAMAVGLEKLAGFLGGGYTSWLQEGREVDHIERLPAAALAERLDDGMQLLDVRERSEWDAGRIPGSVHRPWHDIDAVPEGIDPARPVAAVCGSGERSAVAASLLQHHGASGVLHVVDGGVGSWAAGGGTLES
jgi:hydroxyacylglutathione hydrolase